MVCRLCGGNERLVELFDPQLNNGWLIKMYVLLATGIEIDRLDEISTQLCTDCISMAYATHVFRSKAVKTDRHLWLKNNSASSKESGKTSSEPALENGIRTVVEFVNRTVGTMVPGRRLEMEKPEKLRADAKVQKRLRDNYCDQSNCEATQAKKARSGLNIQSNTVETIQESEKMSKVPHGLFTTNSEVELCNNSKTRTLNLAPISSYRVKKQKRFLNEVDIFPVYSGKWNNNVGGGVDTTTPLNTNIDSTAVDTPNSDLTITENLPEIKETASSFFGDLAMGLQKERSGASNLDETVEYSSKIGETERESDKFVEGRTKIEGKKLIGKSMGTLTRDLTKTTFVLKCGNITKKDGKENRTPNTQLQINPIGKKISILRKKLHSQLVSEEQTPQNHIISTAIVHRECSSGRDYFSDI